VHGGLASVGAGVPDSTCLTYEPCFGLREKAFSLSSNPRFFFRDGSGGSAVDTLTAGIRRREGILALTGEVGTGKTTVCRTVLQGLDRKTFAAFVPDPILSREDLLKILLVDFGVVSPDDTKTDRLRHATRTELSYALHEFLVSLQPLHAFAVVVIDEAQNLPISLLEELRILCDLEHEDKLLQLLLVGQPELDTRLAMPELRQLTQRLVARVNLDPLDREDIGPYITHRLTVAGNGKVTFDEPALERIWAGSRGTPRIINLLCDKALAHAAAVEADGVHAEHIVDAAVDLRIPLGENTSRASVSIRRADTVPMADETPHADGRESHPRQDTRRRRASRQGLPHSYEMRHDAHYVEELESRTTDTTINSTGAAVRLEHSINTPSRRRAFAVIGASILMTLVSVPAYFALVPHGLTSASVDAAAPERAGGGAVASGASATQSSPPVDAERPFAAQTQSSPLRDTGFAIQLATFQGEQRAAESVSELRAGGYDAFGTEVPLRSGGRAYAVFLGPYSDRPAAARDYERALQIPGYTAGQIVELANTSASSKTGR
jgi:type II secretory pathway predicted ATPase ExeA/cell division septation protein DedD